MSPLQQSTLGSGAGEESLQAMTFSFQNSGFIQSLHLQSKGAHTHTHTEKCFQALETKQHIKSPQGMRKKQKKESR